MLHLALMSMRKVLFYALLFHSRLFVKSGASLDFCAALPNVESGWLKHKRPAESLEAWYHGHSDRSAPRSPLLLHMHTDNFEACKHLLKSGASCNYADENGLTPLMHAVQLVKMARLWFLN